MMMMRMMMMGREVGGIGRTEGPDAAVDPRYRGSERSELRGLTFTRERTGNSSIDREGRHELEL